MFFVIKKQKKQFNTLNFKETVWHAYIYLNLSYLTKIMKSESEMNSEIRNEFRNVSKRWSDFCRF